MTKGFNDKKSQSSSCFLPAGGLISWKSKKEEIVSRSNVEAEYVVLLTKKRKPTKETFYMKYIPKELGFMHQKLIILYNRFFATNGKV